MRNRKTIALLVFFALNQVFLSHCGTDRKETEPNNDPEYASPAELGKPVSGSFSDKKDRDFYRFTLPATGTGPLFITGEVSGLKGTDLRLDIILPGRGILFSIDANPLQGEESFGPVAISGEKFLFARVHRAPGDKGEVFPESGYKINIREVSAPVSDPDNFEYEPNQSRKTAAPLPFKKKEIEPDGETAKTGKNKKPKKRFQWHGQLSGFFQHGRQEQAGADRLPADEDWFEIALDKKGLFQFQARLLPLKTSGLNPGLEIRTQKNKTYWFNNFQADGQGEIIEGVKLKGPGKWYLRLWEASGRPTPPDDPWSLTYSYQRWTGERELEPNNQPEEALAFRRDKIHGVLEDEKDVDFFRLGNQTGQDSLQQIRLSTPNDQRLRLEIRFPKGKALVLETPENSNKLVYPNLFIPLGQTMVIRLKSQPQPGAPPGRVNYQIHRQLTQFQGGQEKEPNDSLVLASKTNEDYLPRGFLAYPGDRDFFNVEALDWEKEDTVAISGVPGVKLGVRLLGSSGQKFQEKKGVHYGQGLQLKLKQDCRYLEVYSVSTDPAKHKAKKNYKIDFKEN